MSTKTNFLEWVIHYENILLPYYRDFTEMFPSNKEPSFRDFMAYCYRNTKQTYNRKKMRYEARIYREDINF